MSNIYAHPTTTTSPGQIQALQERLGLRAIVQGHRVHLVGTPRPSAPHGIEQRGRFLFAVGPQ